MIRFNRFSAITIPSAIGTEPPDSDVPLPRATNGTPAAWQALTASTTSSTDSATTTASGSSLKAVRPSEQNTAS